MVFAYTRDNLGADFTLFYYFSIMSAILAIYGCIKTIYSFFFQLTRLEAHEELEEDDIVFENVRKKREE